MSRIFALLLFLPLLVCRGESLIRVSAEDIVDRLRRQGVSVCFERVHNEKKDAITRRQQIESIERIPKSQRTAREEARLKSDLKSKDKGSTIVNWRQVEFNFDYPDHKSDPKDILNKLLIVDPRYEWKIYRNKYIVFPKEGSFNKNLSGFHADDLKFSDFFTAMIEQIAKPSHLNYFLLILGHDWTEDYKNEKYTLNISDTDSISALTAFADTLGPQFVWTVLSVDSDWGNLGITPIRPKNTAEQDAAANP